MNHLIEIKVPDIGDFKNIPVIEVLVKPGDRINKEDALITLESDKATMEVPSPQSGVIREIKVKVGDKLSEGGVVLLLEGTSAEAPKPAPAATVLKAPAAPAVTSSGPVAKGDIQSEVMVLGSGPGGYTAAFRAADLGKQVVLVERYPVLGGVCLNVGCIPSKALLHAARVISEAEEMSPFGIAFGKPKIEIAKLRDWKDGVVDKSIRGLAGLAKQRKVQVVQGVGKFTSPHMIEVKTSNGVKKVSFDYAIIAAGSSVARI